MPIELKRESIQVSEVLDHQKHSSEAYTYIIVPDSKPDILKVLSVDANAVIKEKYIQKDKITVSGNINFKILYLGDGEEKNVKSIYYDTPFSQAVNVPGVDDSIMSNISSKVSNVICNIENSRKLSVQTSIELDCNIVNPADIDLVTEIDSDKVVPYKTETLEVFNEVISQHDVIEIGDTVGIGQGMPMIEELLKADAILSQKDTKIVNNKLVVKGIAKISAVYTDVNATLQVVNQDVPFTEIVDVNGISDDMISDISYKIENLDCQVAEDNDGDRTIIDFDMTIGVDTVAYDRSEIEVINDLYSPEAEIKIHTINANVWSLYGEEKTQIDVKESITLPVDAPDISKIYKVSVNPEITNISLAEGKMFIEGEITAAAEYISDDDKSPMHTAVKKIPFTHKTNITVENENIQPYVNISVDEVSYSASKSHEIDVKLFVGISSKAVNNSNVNIISKIDVDEDLPEYLMPSIVIYFVQSGDTLWNIAKRYRTTIDDIADINNIDPDMTLMPNQKLLIPKRD